MPIQALKDLKKKLGPKYLFDITCKLQFMKSEDVEKVFTGETNSNVIINLILRTGLALLQEQDELSKQIKSYKI